MPLSKSLISFTWQPTNARLKWLYYRPPGTCSRFTNTLRHSSQQHYLPFGDWNNSASSKQQHTHWRRLCCYKNACVEDILLLFVFSKGIMSLADELKQYAALLRQQPVGENWRIRRKTYSVADVIGRFKKCANKKLSHELLSRTDGVVFYRHSRLA